ncbi:hypothetical protein MVES1_000896 [Malassezia vespertilionis]|uniref:Uncharacterized protein n=1 Tax=Malassezia vespertilionis TaxID=2020962 RepID=A0A2N1JDX5_9BASI|nr:uncharacterized protein MVES1_000896 [Malassezia vespertilionis]PKI84733.1 hypothetical protein MVES_000844 [Malassezia vespertilionis]WFD05566.1 hypothetical protein MVES1_000896 [Malassezia vespertilionis]
MYLFPQSGDNVNQPNVTLRWNPKCFSDKTLNLYLYAPDQPQAVLPIHGWLGISSSEGAANVNLNPQWWNKTANAKMNLQFVPSGSQPWETKYPVSRSWTASVPEQAPNGFGSVGSSQYITNFGHTSGNLGSGELAAAIVVPVVVVLALVAAAFVWHKQRADKRAVAHAESVRKSLYAGASTPSMQQSMTQPASVIDTANSYYANPYAYSTNAPIYASPVNDIKESSDSLPSSQSIQVSQDVSPDVSLEQSILPRAAPVLQEDTRRKRKSHRHSREPRQYYSNSDLYDKTGGRRRSRSRRSIVDANYARSMSPDNFRELPRTTWPEDAPDPPEPVPKDYHRIELLDAPMPPVKDVTAIDMSAIPPSMQRYVKADGREPYTFMDGQNTRVSSDAVGNWSRHEKVSAYLAQLPTFESAPEGSHFTSLSELAPQDEVASRRFSDASARTARSRAHSVGSATNAFHDASEDVDFHYH